MSSPPITGNNDLDAYLYSLQLGIEATGTGTGTAAPTTVNSNDIVADYYPNQYMQVRYADDNVGTNISVDQANKKFYGLYNSNSFLASNNPADYTWFELTDTFGTDKFLFFTVLRGRNLKLIIASVIPTTYWAECPTTYIDLDVISEGYIDNTDFFDGYEPVAIVNGLPNASTYTGPNIVYDTVTNKMYRWQAGQWWSNVLAADIEGALGYANFSNSLRPVEVVSALPTTGNFVGRVVLLISDGKIYRYASTGWTAEVPTTDLTGTITNTQIANGSISGTKFASGIEPVTIVTTVPTVKSTSTIFNSTDGKIYKWNGTAYIATIPSTDISGTLADAQIASLAASKVTGQLTDTQLAAISAAKVTGQIAGTQITDGAISTAKISAGAVTANEIAANTITAAKIATGTITATQLAAGSVTTAKLAAGAVTANEIAANTITASQIAANTITSSQIAADTITAGQIAAGAISASELAANAVTANAIAANAVTTAKLDALAITADKIAANAITAGKIATDAVTAGTVAAGAITSDKLAANSVIAGKIAAGVITATELAAGSVTASKISVTDLSAINANLGTITGGSLNIASKFIVDSSGNATIKSSTTGERLEITNSTIKVYDAAGIVRVKIGNLA